uniref:Uncharacterized protein n=1 Tax=Schistocephalus solidus TaxID=70667 RepID=A0A0X3P969_SCHSO
MSLSGVNTMRDLLSLLLPLILCSSCLANIQCPQNSNFYVYIDAEGNITDVTTNVAISQGSDEAPCKAPNFCWQLVSRRQYAIIGGRLTGDHAAAIFYPVDRSRQPVALVFKQKAGQGSDPLMPSNVKVLDTIYVSPNEKVNQRLIFDSEIRSIFVAGSMDLKPSPDQQLLLVTAWNTNLKDMLFLTGHMNQTALTVMITKANETIAQVPLVPLPIPPQSPPRYVSWSTDKTNSIKETSHLLQCLNRCKLSHFLG